MSGSSLAFLLRPRWIAFHVLVVSSIAVMIWLSFWQLDRLDERRDFNDRVAAQAVLAPEPLEDVLVEAGDDIETIEWRQVLVRGTYLPDQILWFNRTQDGLAGDNVLSALATDDDLTVVVNRGFVPLGVETPAPPTADVEVLARVRLPQERQRGELTDANPGGEPLTEVRRIDLGELSAQLPGRVPGVYLDLIDAIPAPGPNDPTPVPAPTLNDGPHLSYAVQWAIFAVCVLIGWVLAVRRSIRARRRTAVTDAAGAPASPDSAPRDDAESASSTTGTSASSPH